MPDDKPLHTGQRCKVYNQCSEYQIAELVQEAMRIAQNLIEE